MKAILKKLLQSRGYDVMPSSTRGIHLMADIKRFAGSTPMRVIFDVGANEGDLSLALSSSFPEAKVYSFEPSPVTFQTLQAKTKGNAQIVAENKALGAAMRQATFFQCENSVNNSLLEVSDDFWDQKISETAVTMDTIDSYCIDNQLESIDLLKVDTQGYDLEVLKGAQKMLKDKRIRIICTEVLFVELYKEQAYFEDIFLYFKSHGYRFSGLYEQHYLTNNFMLWSDAVFVNTSKVNPCTAPFYPG